ncbi:MAG: alpha/beta fold hydrolase [Anaerolineales bacterium]|nr:alpha/beta fold hydrolase [Anaerolineales bacterium]
MNAESIYKSPAGEKEIMALYDAVLARWPVPHETFRLPTRHGKTFVIASGEASASPLILLHGAVSNAVSWVGEVPAYSPCFRVYAVDLPGEPGKSAPNRPAWEGPAFAEWLEDVLDGLKIQRTALLGISQGGWTALKFATCRPERVSKLVLLAPGGVMPTRPSFIRKAIFLSMFGKWGGKKINRMVLGKDPMHPEAVKFMDALMTHFKPRVEKEYLFSDEELQRLDMPVLLLGGTQDAIFPMEGVARRLGKLVPRLETVLLPGMGHALVSMNERVLPFLMK